MCYMGIILYMMFIFLIYGIIGLWDYFILCYMVLCYIFLYRGYCKGYYLLLWYIVLCYMCYKVIRGSYWIIFYLLYGGIIFSICVYWLYGLYDRGWLYFIFMFLFWVIFSGRGFWVLVMFFFLITFALKKYEARTDRKNFNKQRVAKNYVGSLQVVGIYEL